MIGIKKKTSVRAPVRKPPVRVVRQGVNFRKNVQAEKSIQKIKRRGSAKKIRYSVKWIVMLIGLPTLLIIGGWKVMQFYQQSNWLVLRSIEVEGNHNLSREKILENSGLELGVHLFPFNTKSYEQRLDSLPWIKHAQVIRSFPHKLKIIVEEKIPIAMGFEHHGEGLSAEGVLLPDLHYNAFDLPIIDHLFNLDDTKKKSLGTFLGNAQKKYPELFANFSQVKMVSSCDAEIILKDGKQKILVGLGDKSLNSLEFLQALSHQQGARLEEAKTIDLRVEGYAYVQ